MNPLEPISNWLCLLRTAGGLGLEPRSTGPKPVVLPLDDPPAVRTNYPYANSFSNFSERTSSDVQLAIRRFMSVLLLTRTRRTP